jgi:hypothetical protein
VTRHVVYRLLADKTSVFFRLPDNKRRRFRFGDQADSRISVTVGTCNWPLRFFVDKVWLYREADEFEKSEG